MFVLVSVFCERVRIKESAGTPDFFVAQTPWKLKLAKINQCKVIFKTIYLFFV
jgi:hypothetical protein